MVVERSIPRPGQKPVDYDAKIEELTRLLEFFKVRNNKLIKVNKWLIDHLDEDDKVFFDSFIDLVGIDE